MDALVAEVAVAVVPVPVPVVVEAIGVERPLGRRPEPDVVIDVGGSRAIGLVPDRATRLVAEPLGHVDLAELARAQKRDGVLNALVAAALRAGLDDALVLSRGLDHAPAFADVVADGLLDIDVLAGLARPDRRQRVPVVGRGDRDGVDRLVVEQAANVLNDLGRGLGVSLDHLGAAAGCARSTSQIAVMRTSLRWLQPAMWSLPRPLTPQTAIRTVSFGPDGLVSPSPSSGAAMAFTPGIAAIAAASLGGVRKKLSARQRAHGWGPLHGDGSAGGDRTEILLSNRGSEGGVKRGVPSDSQ